MKQAHISGIGVLCAVWLGMAGPTAANIKEQTSWPSVPSDGQTISLPSPGGANVVPGFAPCPNAYLRQPINVGPNGQVGSGARSKQKAADTAMGLVGGFLGGGGGRSRGGGDGPDLARCKIKKKKEMTVFEDPQTGVSLRVGAKRVKGDLVVFARIEKAPGKGTFQTAFLENGGGETLPPQDVGICDLWGEWSLTVSWTKTTYVDGQKVSEESGGWSESGKFSLPGVMTSGGAPDGLWRRLGFSNATNGAKMISMHYPESVLQNGGGQLQTVIHVTRPKLDPVTTVPFALTLTETADGFAFSRAANTCE